MSTLAVIGAGRVGTALALALQEKGYTVAGVCCRRRESASLAAERLGCRYTLQPEKIARGAQIVLITTPDHSIEAVCRGLASAGGIFPGQVVLHASGAHSSSILSAARERGAAVLSMHPLQTFPSVEAGVRNLEGSYFTLEGDREALEAGFAMVKAMGGHALTIPTEMKPLYHAAACVACNYFVSLVDLALKMMQEAGVSCELTLPALLPLITGTLANIEKVGVPAALTGPIDRGESGTIKAHLDAIETAMPEAAGLYRLLAIYTADVAKRKGTLDSQTWQEIMELVGCRLEAASS